MFRTELPLVPSSQQLPLSARVLTIGSCFSDMVGNRLKDAKVSTLANPFGTVFNPVTACKLLRAAVGEDADWQQHVVEARGRWQSYDLHANLGADSPVELLQMLQQLLRDTGVFLATADVVVLTLGTAWAYRLKETDELVSNCHKVPAERFTKELLTPDEIINAVAETHAYLRLRNPKLRFVLTVSPVRHLKDTLPLNAVSKSVLRVACHYLSELLPDVAYFPAYELLLDDLRDYRFYAADMLHPSSVAEDYIWERFARTYFDADFGRFRKEWESVRQALTHQPLHPAAPEHRQFLTSTLERLEKLANRADMRMEILDVRKQLENLPEPKPTLVPELRPEDDEERIDVGVDSAVEQQHVPEAATPEQEFVEEEEAETLAEAMEEASQPKKKRRNRGGAKRNKKKHAARLAEEAAAAAGTATIASATESAQADVTSEEAAPAPADSSEVVTVSFDPEAVLQTAVERRRRGSRRGRGGKKLAEAAPMADVVPEEPASEDTTVPELIEPEAVTTESVQVDASELPVVLPTPQKPVRTGRSASEVRAAALRKFRRPDSRIKALYATPAATPPVAEEVPTDAPPTLSDSTVTPVSLTEAAVEVPLQEQVPADATPVVVPRPPVVSAIPPVKGTGASGRLSATGQASLSAGKTQEPTPPPMPEVEPVVQSVPDSPAPEAPVEAASPAAPEEVVDTSVEQAPEAAPKKARRKPISSKAKQEPSAADPAASAKPKAKARKPTAKPDQGAVTPEAPAPDDASASATTKKTRRKPAAKPAEPIPDSVPATPKRAPRPPRRKPTATDETPDAS